jgi:hypothetical protein
MMESNPATRAWQWQDATDVVTNTPAQNILEESLISSYVPTLRGAAPGVLEAGAGHKRRAGLANMPKN